jgi:hypothetical protein
VRPLRKLAISIFTHPIIIGILLGLAWRFTGWDIPPIPFQILDMLGSTAVPCALFSAGMALKRYGLAGDLRITLTVSFFKLIVQPGLVFLFGAYVLQLPPSLAGRGGAVCRLSVRHQRLSACQPLRHRRAHRVLLDCAFDGACHRVGDRLALGSDQLDAGSSLSP